MHKAKTFLMFALAAVVAVFLVSSVSAYSIWEPKYESYRLGADKYNSGSYSSTLTYEKTVVENEDRFSSSKETTIKKTESETYTPSRINSNSRRYYDNDYNDNYRYEDGRYNYPRYIYTDSLGRTRYYDRDDYVVNNYETYVRYDDGSWYPSSNWRFKEVYNSRDYKNENDYGYDYYYEPRYDWHQGIYNWRY